MQLETTNKNLKNRSQLAKKERIIITISQSRKLGPGNKLEREEKCIPLRTYNLTMSKCMENKIMEVLSLSLYVPWFRFPGKIIKRKMEEIMSVIIKSLHDLFFSFESLARVGGTSSVPFDPLSPLYYLFFFLIFLSSQSISLLHNRVTAQI